MNEKIDEVTQGEYTKVYQYDHQIEPYVFEGESFYDAVDDQYAMQTNAMEYWSIAYDESTGDMYYFEYRTGKTQWEPPRHLVYQDSSQVLLWDATEQWFYIYDMKTHTSEWLEHFDGNIMHQSWERHEDCLSQATTEELELEDTRSIDTCERRFFNQTPSEDSKTQYPSQHSDGGLSLKVCRNDDTCICISCFLPSMDIVFNQDERS